MIELKLSPGPLLEQNNWVYDEATESGSWVARDVTAIAHEFLYRQLDVHTDVTLADLFRLVTDNPVMQAVFRQEYIKELCEEARKGPLPPTGEGWEQLAYLELYQQWGLNTSTGEYEGVGRYSFHGMGHVLEENIFQGDWLMHKKGEAIQWSVSVTPIRELLHLPLRVRQSVTICEEDFDSKNSGKVIQSGTSAGLTLGSFIRETLWELSWHGTPEESAEFSDKLKEQVSEIKEGTVELIPADDVFERLGFAPEKAVYAKFFQGLDSGDESTKGVLAELKLLLRALEDEDAAGPALDLALGAHTDLALAMQKGLTLRDEYWALTGRELRRLIRTERDAPRSAEAGSK